VFNKNKNKNKFEELEKSNNKEEMLIETLLLHQSDKIIKPIIGNKLIEVFSVTTFNKSKLPFTVWKIDKIKECIKQNSITHIENFLFSIYSCMEQYFNSQGNEDNLLNVLNYFETIIQDKEIANKIINTSFVSLLILILKSNNSKSSF